MRRPHRPDHRPSLLHQRHTHTDHGKAAHEVGRAVHRVDDPHTGGGLAAAFLGQYRDVWRAATQHCNGGPLGLAVDRGDVVAEALLLRGARRGIAVGNDGRRRAHGGQR